MTSIFSELQSQGSNHPRDKTEVQSSEYKTTLLHMASWASETHSPGQCVRKCRSALTSNHWSTYLLIFISFPGRGVSVNTGFHVTVFVISKWNQKLFRVLASCVSNLSCKEHKVRGVGQVLLSQPEIKGSLNKTHHQISPHHVL